jgi:GNAT superfamily N-acetyltransferase
VKPDTDYEFSDQRGRLDLDVVWGYLSTDAYWGRWRSRGDFDAQVASAWRLGGVYLGDQTIGFARAISDGVSFAYLADLFILAEHRGQGLGRGLVRLMIDDGPGAGFRWLLHTDDAHALYADFGFVAPDSTLLERAGSPANEPVRSRSDSA